MTLRQHPGHCVHCGRKLTTAEIIERWCEDCSAPSDVKRKDERVAA